MALRGCARGIRRRLPVAAAAAVVAIGAGSAGAGAAVARVAHSDGIGAAKPIDLPVVSRAEPGRCRTTGAEQEPDVAADPRDPRRLVVAWMNAVGVTVDASGDGGRSWREVVLPRLTTCSGGAYQDVFDPGVSFGRDGTAYLSLVGAVHYRPCRFAILVLRSHDGGVRWSHPATVAPARKCNDKQRGPVVADPATPGRVFVTWVDYPGTGPGEIYLASSSDHGRRWSAPTALYTTPAGRYPDFCELHALPRGGLLATFIQLHSVFGSAAPDERWEVLATGSHDGGRTWSAPVQVGSASARLPSDPQPRPRRPSLIRAIARPAAAVAPGGSVLVTWQEIGSASASSIMLARSDDGGTTWSPPRALASGSDQKLQPEVAVDARGRVGIVYYAVARGRGPLRTDVWALRSDAGAGAFRRFHLAGPFDMRRVGTSGDVVSGYFLGDYFGLAPAGGGVVAAFAEARPAARRHRSDVFFARIAL